MTRRDWFARAGRMVPFLPALPAILSRVPQAPAWPQIRQGVELVRTGLNIGSGAFPFRWVSYTPARQRAIGWLGWVEDGAGRTVGFVDRQWQVWRTP